MDTVKQTWNSSGSWVFQQDAFNHSDGNSPNQNRKMNSSNKIEICIPNMRYPKCKQNLWDTHPNLLWRCHQWEKWRMSNEFAFPKVSTQQMFGSQEDYMKIDLRWGSREHELSFKSSLRPEIVLPPTADEPQAVDRSIDRVRWWCNSRHWSLLRDIRQNHDKSLTNERRGEPGASYERRYSDSAYMH